MKKKSRKLVLFLAGLVMVIVMSSCTGQESGIKKRYTDLSDYNTSYTACERNQDGTYSFYIYAAPVQFQQGETYLKKELSIVESDKNGYTYMNKSSDIKTYFPSEITGNFLIRNEQGDIRFCFTKNVSGFGRGEKMVFENLYGDQVEAVRYESDKGMQIYCYATISGIQIELVCQKESSLPEMDFEADVTSMTRQKNGYIVFHDREETAVVIYEPVVKAANSDEPQFGSAIYGKERNGLYHLWIEPPECMNKEEVRLLYSIERYVNKIPDSTVYSKKNINNYLRSYAVVGEHQDFGSGIHYLRFRLQYYLSMDTNNVISARYYLKNLREGNDKAALGLYRNLDQWSSTQMLWETKVESDKEAYSWGSYADNGWICFDVTDYVKSCLKSEDWMEESIGSTLKCEDGYALVATSDNSLYVPYLEIVMKDLPEGFTGQENVNPPLPIQ